MGNDQKSGAKPSADFERRQSERQPTENPSDSEQNQELNPPKPEESAEGSQTRG